MEDDPVTDSEPPAPPPLPEPKGRRRILLIAVALVVVVAAGAAAFLAFHHKGKSTHTIIGEMTINGSSNFDTDGDLHCSGTSGYDDLAQGGGVVVTSDGKTEGLGELSAGKVTFDTGTSPTACIFTFTIKDVPDRDFYEVEVTHRGKLTYSKAKLEKAHWLVFTTIGS